MTYVPRTLEPFFIRNQQDFPVLLVTGPRQVGKTTFLRHLADQDRTYISLDDPNLAAQAREDPALFIQNYPPPVLIDEIQYAPELLPFIKIQVDKTQRGGDFWLTGSQQFHMMKNVTESLAGRVGIFHLNGLSLIEKNHCASTAQVPFLPNKSLAQDSTKNLPSYSIDSLYQMIWRGSYPKLALNKHTDWKLFYDSYLQTYISRDIRDFTSISDETSFLFFLKSAAARSGQMVNFADMARDAGISQVTAKKWLSILTTSNIVYLLPSYHTNLTKRLVKTPKLYFLDTGFCAYLCGWLTAETLKSGAMSGAILETFVVTEIIKSYWYRGVLPSLYYFRDKDGREIDLMIVRDDTAYPIEIKKTASPNKACIRHFKALDTTRLKQGTGALITLSPDIIFVDHDTHTLPAWAMT